ncbi:MAG: DUF5606 domain-containing protein [Chitinophagaceae bacterium]
MEYQQIVSITGLTGLYEVVSSKNDGAIVRSLEDQSTKFVSSRLHNVSYLETIEVYTQEDNVNLVEIFMAMQSNNAKLPAEKDAKEVKQYFEKVFPQLDFERVYHSDMKKMVRWFQILQSSKIELKLSEPEPEVEDVEEAPVEAPKKKSETKKAEKPNTEEKSTAKKAATKTEVTEESPKKTAKKSTKTETAAKEAPKKTSKKS